MSRTAHRAVVVLLVALAGAALVAAAASPAAAQDRPDVEVTYEYQYDQEAQDLLIDVTVQGADAVDDTIWVNVADYEEVHSTDGMEQVEGSWRVASDADTATMTYSQPVEEAMVNFSANDDLYIELRAEDHSWVAVEADTQVLGSYRYNLVESHVAVRGERFDATDVPGPYLLFGDVEVATAQAQDTTVNVVGSPDEMPERPAVVASRLADVSDAVGRASFDHDEVTAFAAPTLENASGFAPSEHRHYTQADVSVYDPGSTWIHELVHNSDGTDLAADMTWFAEGYADYGAVLYGMDAGYQSYDQYRAELEEWSGERVVLAEERPSTADVNYEQGSRLLARLDHDLREVTGGDADVRDVVARMHDADKVDLQTFLAIVEEVTAAEASSSEAEALRSDVETWVTTTEPILEDGVWDYEEHERVFGPAPHVETSVAAVGEVDERHLATEWGTATTTGRTLTANVTVENHADVEFRTRVPVTVERSDTELVAETNYVAVSPGENRTLSYTRPLDETGSYTVDLRDRTYTVDVRDVDAVVSLGDVDAADPADPVHVGDADRLVVHAPTSYEYEVSTLDGEHVASGDPLLGTGRVDGDAFDRSTTYEVAYDTGEETHPRHVTTLDRVQGTVPVDVNGDGLHRDFNGDGSVTQTDVSVFFSVQHRPSVQNHPEAYDFNGDGDVSLADVVMLFEDL